MAFERQLEELALKFTLQVELQTTTLTTLFKTVETKMAESRFNWAFDYPPDVPDDASEAEKLPVRVLVPNPRNGRKANGPLWLAQHEPLRNEEMTLPSMLQDRTLNPTRRGKSMVLGGPQRDTWSIILGELSISYHSSLIS